MRCSFCYPSGAVSSLANGPTRHFFGLLLRQLKQRGAHDALFKPFFVHQAGTHQTFPIS